MFEIELGSGKGERVWGSEKSNVWAKEDGGGGGAVKDGKTGSVGMKLK